jgi:DNA-binding NtrC family response regulator
MSMDAVSVTARTGPDPAKPLQAQRIGGPLNRNVPKPPDAAPFIAAPSIASTNNACVLIVDDNEAVRETLADILDSAGFCPIQAADAAQALMIMRERSDIDALVTDLSMPGADGITLIRQARAIHPGLPAILLTGYAEAVSSVSTIAGGNFHVLRKPVESDRLTEQVFLLITRARAT